MTGGIEEAPVKGRANGEEEKTDWHQYQSALGAAWLE